MITLIILSLLLTLIQLLTPAVLNSKNLDMRVEFILQYKIIPLIIYAFKK